MSCTRFFLFVTVFLAPCLLPAQDFVVTAKGDTLQGSVKMAVNGYEKRLNITSPDGKKTSLSVVQVKSFTLSGERYETVRSVDTYEFMKPLKTGYLSLYAFRKENQLSWDGRYLMKRDGKGMEVPNLAFKKNMERFLLDCPDVSVAVGEGKLGSSDLNQIIDTFNACITERTGTFAATTNRTEVWDVLQRDVDASALATKSDVTEMISEAKNKIRRGEPLPKFLVDALTQALAGDENLTAKLKSALQAN